MGRVHKGTDQGFTLLEILIALTVTATVMSALFGVYASCLEVARDIEFSSRADSMMRMVVSRITNDLRSYASLAAADLMVVGAGDPGSDVNASEENSRSRNNAALMDVPLFTGNEIPTSLPDKDGVVVMVFPTRASLGFARDDGLQRINMVSYVLVPEDGEVENGTYTLLRREVPFAGLYPGLKAETVELADGLVWSSSIGPRYQDEQGAWVRTWDGAARRQAQESELPGLIRWTLRMDQEGRRMAYTMAVRPLMAKAGGS